MPVSDFPTEKEIRVIGKISEVEYGSYVALDR